MFLCALSALPESGYSTRFPTWRTDRDVLLALPHHPSSVPERAADHVCHHIISVDKGPTVFIVDHHQPHDCAAAEVLAHSECHLAAESSSASSLAIAPSPPAPVPPSSSALPPTRLPAPALNQPFPAASNAALASAPSTTALAPPYAASSAALAPAPHPMASDAADTILGTAAFPAMPCAKSTSLPWWVVTLAWWVATAVYSLFTFACFSLILSPPPVAPPTPAAASSASGGAAVPPSPLHLVPPAPVPAATPADVLARLQQHESYRKLHSTAGLHTMQDRTLH